MWGLIATAVVSVFGFIAKFFGLFKTVVLRSFNLFTHANILVGQIAILLFHIGYVITVFGLSITGLVYIYNLFNDILAYILTGFNETFTSCMATVFTCSGIYNALTQGFSILWSALSSILILKLYILLKNNIHIISDQAWKVGVMLGQMLNSNR